MLDIVPTSAIDLPTANGTVQAMLDIILTNASNGIPTMKTDLADFSEDEISAHFPAARRLANKQFVRQVGDDPSYETREQRLKRASGLTLGLMPAMPQVHERLRSNGFSNAEIAEFLPDLLTRAAQRFVVKMMGERAQ
jgi:hypothetical protein